MLAAPESQENIAELLFDWTQEDETWLLTEFGRNPLFEDMISYIQTYEGMGCEFNVWFYGDLPVAITAVLDDAPSNQKPWLGTIVVHPMKRKSGIGCSVIRTLLGEKNDVVFLGIPYELNEWSLFLGKCGFEQYGIEEEGKKYLILVHPNG
ncbi:GNAT family N-acetyltransferase [Pseudalkalibacillus sp. NRS-1564]|uniref:GNAT family N-acetyltransferase n=1 Tax=Pseudalkalibacillus sp. NRS-1564 TaxID=3233900 RepID=UPI003D2E24AA